MRKWVIAILGFFAISSVLFRVEAQAGVPRLTLLSTIHRAYQGGFGNNPEQFDFSPDGTMLASGDGTSLVIWDVQTGDAITIFPDHAGEVRSVDWSPDGKYIASGIFTPGNSVLVRAAETGEILYRFPSRQGETLAWSPDSKLLALQGDVLINMYDIDTGQQVSALEHWGLIYQIAWSPDGTMLASAGGWTNNYLHIWDLQGNMLATFLARESVAWSSNSRYIATAGQIRSIKTGLPVLIIPELTGRMAWHPGGRWIASSAIEATPLLIDTLTGEVLPVDFGIDECGASVLIWSQDGTKLATLCYEENSDGTLSVNIVIWELGA